MTLENIPTVPDVQPGNVSIGSERRISAIAQLADTDGACVCVRAGQLTFGSVDIFRRFRLSQQTLGHK